MFKAKLISEDRYYKLRRISAILGFILAPVYGISFIDNFPWWGFIIVLLFIIVVFTFNHKIIKSMGQIFGKKRMVLDYDVIRILDRKKEEVQQFNVKLIDQLILRTNFEIAQEKISDVFREIFKGSYNYNELEVHDKSGRHSYKFEFDSYYMIKQLEKIIAYWKQQGVSVSVESGVSK